MRAPADARTCRVCGCWELQACEVGCAWATADRCTACPANAPMVLPITAAHVANATLAEMARLGWKTVGGEQMLRLMHRAVEYPNLVFLSTQRGEVIVRREIYVGAMAVDLIGWDAAAAALLNERRAAA